MSERTTDRLKSLGWHAAVGAAVACKSYQTAVGPKEAQAYLESWGGGRFVLTGEYYSEGRNALATVRVPMDASMNHGAHGLAVRQFVDAADSRVAETYAVRLMRLEAVEGLIPAPPAGS